MKEKRKRERGVERQGRMEGRKEGRKEEKIWTLVHFNIFHNAMIFHDNIRH
jgi:hypothetical protein